jgi:hypothetical protein
MNRGNGKRLVDFRSPDTWARVLFLLAGEGDVKLTNQRAADMKVLMENMGHPAACGGCKQFGLSNSQLRPSVAARRDEKLCRCWLLAF